MDRKKGLVKISQLPEANSGNTKAFYHKNNSLYY